MIPEPRYAVDEYLFRRVCPQCEGAEVRRESNGTKHGRVRKCPWCVDGLTPVPVGAT